MKNPQKKPDTFFRSEFFNIKKTSRSEEFDFFRRLFFTIRFILFFSFFFLFSPKKNKMAAESELRRLADMCTVVKPFRETTEAVSNSAQINEWFNGLQVSRGVAAPSSEMLVVFGKAGTGKRHLVCHLASSNGINVVVVPENVIVGTRWEIVYEFYQIALERQPCIVYFGDRGAFYSGTEKHWSGYHTEVQAMLGAIGRLPPTARVWTVVSSDVSPKILHPKILAHVNNHGTIAMVESAIPEQFRREFIQREISRLTNVDTERVSFHAVDHIHKHSKYCTFGVIQSFIILVVNHVRSQSSVYRRKNNERMFTEDKMVAAIRELLYKHQIVDKATGQRFMEISVDKHPNTRALAELWTTTMKEVVDMRLFAQIPRAYSTIDYVPGTDRFGFESESSDDEMDGHSQPEKPPTSERIDRLVAIAQTHPVLSQRLASSEPEPLREVATWTCPTSPTPSAIESERAPPKRRAQKHPTPPRTPSIDYEDDTPKASPKRKHEEPSSSDSDSSQKKQRKESESDEEEEEGFCPF